MEGVQQPNIYCQYTLCVSDAMRAGVYACEFEVKKT